MATETTTSLSWVQKTPGVCGGRACIRKTRITVWGLVNSRRLGLSEEQILENIVGLTPEDIQVAWDYYREHPADAPGPPSPNRRRGREPCHCDQSVGERSQR